MLGRVPSLTFFAALGQLANNIYLCRVKSRAFSSVGLEHYLDRVGVGGSSPPRLTKQKQTLSHGVMVAQQILVLFVKVRVLMRQQRKAALNHLSAAFFAFGLLCISPKGCCPLGTSVRLEGAVAFAVFAGWQRRYSLSII